LKIEQNTGLQGYKAVYSNHSFKKSTKHGVKSSLQKSIIQKKPKTQGYRGKRHFTEINHSKKVQKTGLQGYKAVYSNRSFKESKNKWLQGNKGVYKNRSFKKSKNKRSQAVHRNRSFKKE
jgi:hypothetical protein